MYFGVGGMTTCRTAHTSDTLIPSNQDTLLHNLRKMDGSNHLRDVIQLWPNPIRNEVSLKSQNPITKVSILEITGKTIRQWTGNYGLVFKQNLAGLSPGTYICRVTTSHSSESQLFVIQK